MPLRATSTVACGLVMVGSGTDTYDPVCELVEGHDGPCRSTAAIDQHRLATGVENCPKCGANLQGAPIPLEDRHAFGATHFSRKIGISERDRVVCWRCPDCDGEWPR